MDGDREWLNEDFKTCKAAVTLCLKELNRDEDLPAGSILQVQSVTNVSIPLKSQSETRQDYDPKQHILKIALTDGKESAHAILYEPHSKLSVDTPPGTKIQLVKGIPFGPTRILKFTRTNVEVLGGFVEKLVEHWKVQKEHDHKSAWGKLITNPGDDGPPKFRPFNPRGRIPTIGNVDLRKAKAMDLLEEVKAKSDQAQGKESKTEFDLQRQEAISDLAKHANKKTFSVSKQFPQNEPQVQPPAPTVKRERTTSYQKCTDDPGQEPKPRFQSRKSKMEEDQLLAQYTYRGGQHSLMEHLSDFLGNNSSNSTSASDNRNEPNRTWSDMDSLSNQFGRLDTRNDYSQGSSHTFYRGGNRGRGADFRNFSPREHSRQDDYHDDLRGHGYRGHRGRGGRGRGRGRGSYQDYRQDSAPKTTASTYVPDLSSFPTLGVDAHYMQRH